jgi:hypothetical protein
MINNKIGQQVISTYMRSSPYKYTHELMTAKQNKQTNLLKNRSKVCVILLSFHELHNFGQVGNEC